MIVPISTAVERKSLVEPPECARMGRICRGESARLIVKEPMLKLASQSSLHVAERTGLSSSGDFLDSPLRPQIIEIESEIQRAVDSDPEFSTGAQFGDALKQRFDWVTNGSPSGAAELTAFCMEKGEPADMLWRVFNRGVNNNPEGHFVLGALYARGVVVTADLERAKKHFEFAARFDLPMAEQYLVRAEQITRRAAA